MLATGERIPRGRSLRARLLIAELAPQEVNRAVLSECQTMARQGEFATAMAAFLSWVAQRYEELQQQIGTRVRELRARPVNYGAHARLPAALAELQSGWEIWLRFACQVGAIGQEKQAELERRRRKALDELGAQQAAYQVTDDPALRFLALLRAALLTGRAHLAGRAGGVPQTPVRWGWMRNNAGRWTGRGVRLGWVDGDDLYLDSPSSYRAARQMARLDPLEFSEQTLRKRLHDRGLLATIDAGRKTLLVRKTLGGCLRCVLHIKARNLLQNN